MAVEQQRETIKQNETELSANHVRINISLAIQMTESERVFVPAKFAFGESVVMAT